jgi:hypothetical protein
MPLTVLNAAHTLQSSRHSLYGLLLEHAQQVLLSKGCQTCAMGHTEK